MGQAEVLVTVDMVELEGLPMHSEVINQMVQVVLEDLLEMVVVLVKMAFRDPYLIKVIYFVVKKRQHASILVTIEL